MYVYTARILLGNEEIASNSGDDLDVLFAWMLYQAQGKIERYTGYIINNETQEIVKKFRRCSIE